MPNIAYHSALLEGKIVRKLYQAMLPMIVRRPICVPQELSFNVVTYSGQKTLPEQVASIRSFLANVGRPKKFTVVSDGSYTATSAGLLEKIDTCVRVQQEQPPLAPDLADDVRAYLVRHPTGKQLALLMSLPANGPTLYMDSDVLFFPGAHVMVDLFQAEWVPAFYLADFRFSGDERLILTASEKQNPANTGFVLLFQKLDWSLGLERLAKLDGAPNFFTNQTVTHLCLHANGARAFDPQKFVLQLDDQTIYRDKYASPSLVMRHYVNPVRHKFWTTLAHRGWN